MTAMKLYDNRVWGKEVSMYGLEHNRLDYRCLAQIVGDMILNNNIMSLYYDSFELENGCDFDEETDTFAEIFQYYIINDAGAEFLKDNTDELVYYSHDLDMYLWGITHWGTGWDYVLTDIQLVKAEY
jgi:hypothetical protein